MPTFRPEQLAEWCNGDWINGEPETVVGVSHDTRVIDPGNLFFAIQGDRFDGHHFVEDALSRGAAAAVVNRSQALQFAGPSCVLCVDDVLTALGDIARGYRREWNARIVGVTGSVGKTTVKEMIADMLAVEETTARSFGNWNNNIGLPLSMLNFELGSAFGVFEVGMNHPGELEPLCELLEPAYGVVTTIGPVHLEFFNTVDDIAREKATLVRSLPPHGLAVLSCDGPWFDLLSNHAACRIVTVSMQGDEEADYIREPTSSRGDILRVRERETEEVYEYPMPLPGEYIMANAIRALALGRCLGMPQKPIADALKNYKPLQMRWNTETIAGVRFVNDAYNANPVSMQAALDTFEEVLIDGRRWLVLGGMRELGPAEREKHLAVGNKVAYGAWDGLVTVGELGSMIADGAAVEGMAEGRIVRCADVKEAVQALREKVSGGDAVLLKASRGEHLEQVLDLWREEVKA